MLLGAVNIRAALALFACIDPQPVLNSFNHSKVLCRMGQRGAAAVAAAVVGGAIRPVVDGNNMEQGHVHCAPAR